MNINNIYDKQYYDPKIAKLNIFNNSTVSKIKEFKHKYYGKTIGFTCSAFDVLHAGHYLMLKDAKEHCDILIVGLHTDPNIDRSSKNIPIQSLEERRVQLEGCRYIDEIIEYATEDDLLNILIYLKPEIRVLGTDWKDKEYTGYNLGYTKIHWHERNHSWSTTDLRRRIVERTGNK